MEAALNPFRPGSGLRPPDLAGREAERAAFDLVVAKSKQRVYGRGLVLSGLRGVGKTTLLNDLASQSDHHGWLNIKLEARPDERGAAIFRLQLAAELELGLKKFVHRHKLGKAKDGLIGIAKSISISVGPAGVTVGANGAGATTTQTEARTLELDLIAAISELSDTAKKLGVCVGLFIDEMQDLDHEIAAALLAVQHRAGQEEWAFCLSGAGLPTLPSVLASARSYSERQFDYRSIGPLGEEAAAQAIVGPIEACGCSIQPDALETLLAASGGYPYFLQEFGYAIWEVSPAAIFTAEDALAAVDVGTAALDAGFFPSRWDRATPREKDYLRAIAEADSEAPKSGKVAEKMGQVTTAVSDVRASTIEKGLVWSPEHGRVAFTVPGMTEFIRRQPRP